MRRLGPLMKYGRTHRSRSGSGVGERVGSIGLAQCLARKPGGGKTEAEAKGAATMSGILKWLSTAGAR